MFPSLYLWIVLDISNPALYSVSCMTNPVWLNVWSMSRYYSGMFSSVRETNRNGLNGTWRVWYHPSWSSIQLLGNSYRPVFAVPSWAFRLCPDMMKSCTWCSCYIHLCFSKRRSYNYQLKSFNDYCCLTIGMFMTLCFGFDVNSKPLPIFLCWNFYNVSKILSSLQTTVTSWC